MRGIIGRLRSLGRELKRRRVYRASAIYLASAFVVLQVADIVFPALALPEWMFTLLVLLTITGFPVALVVAWAYDVTTEGILKADHGAEIGDDAVALGLRWTFAGLVTVLSFGLGAAAWWLWLPPAAGGRESTRVAPAGAAPPDPARIAVLYFDDHSPGDSLQYLADGLTEGLINQLSQVGGLEVVSRNGVKLFRDQAVSTDSIVKVLGAGSLVEGSVARGPNGLRVTVQLVDGRTNTQLESRVLEVDRQALFALQDSLTEEVARGLRRRLGRELERQKTRSGTSSVEAWDLLQQAQRLQDSFEELNRADSLAAERLLRRADDLLARARERDREWVELAVERAETAFMLAQVTREGPRGLEPEWGREALSRAEGAVELDPADPTAHQILGRVLAGLAVGAPADEATRLWSEAEDAFRRALELDGEFAPAWWSLSSLLLERGRFAEARRAAARALAVDTYLDVDAGAVHELYLSAMNLEEFIEAQHWCREGRRRFPDDEQFVVCQLFILASVPGVEPDVSRAWSLVDSLVRVVSRRQRDRYRAFGTMQAAKVAARAGLPDSARAVIRAVTGDETPAWLAYDEAHARLLLGEREEALRLLERYLRYQPADREFLPEDWWFRPLWSDPQFRALVEEG